MIILEKPNFHPYVCISCGNSTGRKWFVSLDLPLDTFFNPVNNGNVFYCNVCWENLATDVARAAHTYLIGMDPWENNELVVPTYENETELIEEVSFGRATTSIAEHSSTAERSDPAPEPDHSESQPSTDNDETEPVSEFRLFFGDGGGDTGTAGPDSIPTGGNVTDTPEESEEETEGEESGNDDESA